MRALLLLIATSLLLGNHLLAQSEENEAIEFGKAEAIQSEILGEERKLMVYVPEGPKDAKYPVIYLLDGDAHYYSVSGMVRQLSTINGNTTLPKMIVVAIPNTNRTRDLTPSKGDPADPYYDSAMAEVSGGGEKFMAFLKEELIPHVEESYPTLPYRTFIGHSLGGLMVMHAWLNHTDLFNAYVAIDPSMWWANQSLLKEIKQTPIDKKFSHKFLALAIANTMGKDMDTLSVQQDQSVENAHIRAILDLHKHLDKQSGEHLTYLGTYYKDDSHGSVPLIAEYDALRFIFNNYNLNFGPMDVLPSDVDFTLDLRRHYKKASEVYGFTVRPEEGYINMIGYFLMSKQELEKAKSFFQLNTEYFPESSNAYDSLGDCHMALGEKKKAIKSFEKSISLDENSPSKEKLAKLLGEK